MYSVFFSSESDDRASSRRSSCLRSINRSVRKSFQSQVNKSNAKKHGGLRRNIRFLNCGLPRIEGANFLHQSRLSHSAANRRLILPTQRTKRTDCHCVRATEHGHARLWQENDSRHI